MRRIWFLLIIVLFSCQSNPEKPGPTTLDQLHSRIDEVFDTNLRKDEPGAALLIAYDGKMLMGKGYGLRDLESKTPITSSTNMRMASVSKQFTALTILSLIDKGKLSLKDSVTSIYPYEIFEGVTIEQLINHTSGIADAEEAFFAIWDSTKIAENKDLVDWYAANPVSPAKPGGKYRYNNGAYELLAAIAEESSGMGFAQFAKEHVFQRAGMKETNFFNLAHPIDIKERAYCYQKDSVGNWNKVDGHFLNGLLGAGGVYTNINDYFRYDQALRKRTILSDSLHDRIFSHSSMALPTSDYRNFVFVHDDPIYYAMGWNICRDIAFHGGGWFGTSTFVIRELDRPLTIAIFTNSELLFESDLTNEVYEIVDDYVKNQETIDH
ncbi:MAG: beta-lactamase family protein [Cyclobacteriaceae bacterium]|nr:beta-lactamase family protein [Cyclobacteriaceae bacterium]